MLIRAVLALVLLSFTPACSQEQVPVPASSDPHGKDLVEGAVVAAVESSGGVRLYKIIHVDDFPDPIGYHLHMTAYDPKPSDFQEAANMWKHKRKSFTVAKDWMDVALVLFIKRDHRVLSVEPVTDEEKAPYLQMKESRRLPR